MLDPTTFDYIIAFHPAGFLTIEIYKKETREFIGYLKSQNYPHGPIQYQNLDCAQKQLKKRLQKAISEMPESNTGQIQPIDRYRGRLGRRSVGH